MEYDPVASEYRSYKTAERRIIRWCINTVRETCNVPVLLGLSRHCGDSSQIDIVRIGAGRLERLAEEIRRVAEERKKAPFGLSDIIKLVESAIRGRRYCAGWYEVGRRKGDIDSDRRHKSWVDALRSALSELKAAQQQDTRSEEQTPDLRSEAQKLADAINVFDYLETEDISASFQEYLDDGTSPAASKASKRRAPVDIEVEIDEGEEAAFAIGLLMKEFQGLRTYLQRLGAKYKNRTMALQHYACILEFASKLLERKVQTLVQDFPRLKSFDSAVQYLEHSPSPEDSTVEACVDEMLPTKTICSQAWKLIKAWKAQSASNATAQDSHVSGHEADLRDGHDLWRTLLPLRPQILELAKERRNKTIKFELDAFTITILDATLKALNKINITSILIVVIQMDLFDVLGSQRAQAFPDLEISSDRGTAVLKKAHIRLSDRSTGTAPALRKIQQASSDSVGFWMEGEAQTRAEQNLKALVKELPLLAGWLGWGQTDQAHRGGVAICEEGNVVKAAAHLHQLCEHSKWITDGKEVPCITAEWKDLKDFLEYFGAKSILLKEIEDPDKPAERQALLEPKERAARFFTIAMGVDPGQYALHDRVGKNDKKNRVRLPKPNSAHFKKTQLTLPSTLMRCCAEKDIASSTSISSSSLPGIIHGVARAMTAKGGEGLDAAIVAKLRKNANIALDDISMLKIIGASLEADQTKVAFDYYGFFATCAQLLRAIQLDVGRQSNIPDNIEFYEMVERILWDAAERKQSKLLWGSAFIMDKTVGGKGDQKRGSWSSRWAEECVKVALGQEVEGRPQIEMYGFD